ncbi:MAG TPA: type II secretion system F family protein [Polyangiaceae bacterium]|nr:type II secretion system F family protein [Polyangiaceae bacterium]
MQSALTSSSPLKWAALALLTLGLALGTFAVARDRESGPSRAYARYVGSLERKLRLMFDFTRGRNIVIGQAVVAALFLTAGVLFDLPLWYVGVALAAGVPMIYIERKRRERIEAIENQLDGFILTLANALKATPSLGDAFVSVQRLTPPPLQQEIELAAKEIRLGSSLDQALLFMASRIGSRQVDAALSSVLIGRQIGGNMPKILDTMAGSLREMNRLEGVVRTKTAEAKYQLYVLAFTPAVILLAFDAVKDGYFDPLTESVTGFVIIFIAAGLWIASIVTARRILDVDI